MSAKTFAGLTDDQILELARNADAFKEQAATIERERERTAAAKSRENTTTALRAGIARARSHARKSTGVAWFDDMSDEEQMRAIAEANLKEYGSIVPPPMAKLLPLTKECPACHKTKSVVADFGIRNVKGIPRSQAHCSKCRRESDTRKRLLR